LPSRACFDNKEWPEGFCFPVCYSCNHATSNDEQIIAALSRTHSGPDAPINNAELAKYLAGSSNNDPALFGKLLSRVAQELPDGTELIELGPGVREVFQRVLPKWARAFHYLETGEILPTDQRIFGSHMTLPDLQRGRGPTGLFECCIPRPVMRAKKDLSPQFGFARAVSSDRKLFAYIALFRRSIGAWMVVDKNEEVHRSGPEVDFSILPPVRSLGGK
jgi:hypothetical protein